MRVTQHLLGLFMSKCGVLDSPHPGCCLCCACCAGWQDAMAAAFAGASGGGADGQKPLKGPKEAAEVRSPLELLLEEEGCLSVQLCPHVPCNRKDSSCVHEMGIYVCFGGCAAVSNGLQAVHKHFKCSMWHLSLLAAFMCAICCRWHTVLLFIALTCLDLHALLCVCHPCAE